MSYSRINAVGTVAVRELRAALRSKSVIISLAIMLVAAVGLIFAANWFLSDDDEDSPKTLAVVGEVDTAFFEQAAEQSADQTADQDTAAGPAGVGGQAPAGAGLPGMLGGGSARVVTTEASDRDAAAEAVRDGVADAALIRTDGEVELLADGSPDAGIAGLVTAYLQQEAMTGALVESGADPARFAESFHPVEPTVTDVSADAEERSEADGGAVLTVLVGVVVIVMMILLFAALVGGRVTEEKSSRIVELILAAVRPIDLLAGKLLGVLAFGLLGTVVFLAATGGALAVTGLADSLQLDWSVVPLLVLSFILGMLFYGSLYAAAGSLVSRTEDLQSTQGPIMILMLAMIYLPSFGVTFLDATGMQVASWIPPLSLAMAPMQLAAGNWSLGTTLAAYAVCAAATVGILMLVARIYRNAILRNGQKVSWLAAIKG